MFICMLMYKCSLKPYLLKFFYFLKGPFPTIWSDQQCPNVGNHYQKFDLNGCITSCRQNHRCTAINFKYDDCVHRACRDPVPHPTGKYSTYQGFIVKRKWNTLYAIGSSSSKSFSTSSNNNTRDVDQTATTVPTPKQETTTLMLGNEEVTGIQIFIEDIIEIQRLETS